MGFCAKEWATGGMVQPVGVASHGYGTLRRRELVTYDYMGRRIKKIAGSETTTYLHDGWLLVREQSATGVNISTNHYVRDLDLSGALQGAGVVRQGVSHVSDSGIRDAVYFVGLGGESRLGLGFGLGSVRNIRHRMDVVGWQSRLGFGGGAPMETFSNEDIGRDTSTLQVPLEPVRSHLWNETYIRYLRMYPAPRGEGL